MSVNMMAASFRWPGSEGMGGVYASGRRVVIGIVEAPGRGAGRDIEQLGGVGVRGGFDPQRPREPHLKRRGGGRDEDSNDRG